MIPCLTIDTMSFMNKIKRRGPNTDSSGTQNFN